MLQSDLGAVVLRLLDDFFFDKDFGQAGIGVYFGDDVLRRAGVDVAPIRGYQRRLQRLQHNFFRQVALAADLIERKEELALHPSQCSSVCKSLSLPEKRLARLPCPDSLRQRGSRP